MATIKARRQANGSIRYTAIVRKRVGKTIVHREARTFTHRSAALSWVRHREVELENPVALTRKQHSTNLKPESVRELKSPEALVALRSRGPQAIAVTAQPASRAVGRSVRRDRPH